MTNLDAQPQNADWLKLYRPEVSYGWRTKADVLAWLAETGLTVEQFKTMPIYRVNRARLPYLREL